MFLEIPFFLIRSDSESIALLNGMIRLGDGANQMQTNTGAEQLAPSRMCSRGKGDEGRVCVCVCVCVFVCVCGTSGSTCVTWV